MKFLAVFLACIVAAQAATNPCPSYDYWCSHNFHVLPPQSYYCYTVPFKQSWCTSQYYADCLVEYPKSTDEKSCETERDVETVVAEVTAKLLDARQKIENELNGNLAAFTAQIDDIHTQYLETFKRYLKQCYDENSDDFTSRVVAYTAELAAAKTQAITNFHTAVRSAMTKIESFHAQIITRFQSCLTSRNARLTSYNTKLEQYATDVVAHYRERLEAIMNKKVDFVKCVYERLYAGKTKHADYDAFLVEFQAQLQAHVDDDVSVFQTQVNVAVADMKENYRCNSKCYFRTGCYGFSQKSYSRSCVRMPSAPRTSCKLIGVGTFKVDWNGSAYKCLRTCTAAEKTCTFDHEAHITAIADKVVQYKADLATKVAAWKAQVDEWEQTATSTLSDTIQCLMPKSYCGTAPSQAEIDAFRAAAQTQATNWIAAKKAELIAQIDALDKKIIAQIDAWKVRAESYIAKVKAQFDCCVANKTTKIDNYTTSLEARRVDQRSALVAKLNALRKQHKAQFEKFYESSFGVQPADGLIDQMRTHYYGCVDTKVNDVLAKFDAWWDEWKPKLIEHYTCGFKCTVKVTTPSLRLCYNWNFCAPSLKSCQFYC